MSHAEPDDLIATAKMPKWVPRAIVLFWLGFIVTSVVRELFHQLTNFLILLLIALFFALAIEPAVNRLAARGWSRGSATSLLLFGVFVAVGSFGAMIGTLVATQASDLYDHREQYVTDTVEFFNDTLGTSIDSRTWVESISDPSGSVQDFFENQQDRVVDISLGALSGLLQVFSIALFAFYLIADGPRLRRSICSRLSADKQKAVLAVWNLAVQKTGGYIYSRALLAGVSAFFHWIVFQAIGTPAPVALAVWVGLVSQFLPVVGTYLAGLLPVLLAFLDSPIKALIVIVFIAIYQQLENFFLAPRITAQTLELHAAVAFGAAIAGGAILGPLGAVLALPFAAMVQGIVGNWGRRFEIINDPLVGMSTGKKPGKRKFFKK